MNEAYQEVREQLRRQHAMNKNEVHGKEIPTSRAYFYGREIENAGQGSGISFVFKFKIFVFICSVMLFSCYLYGGQDVKKGALMVYQELRTTVINLEEEEPLVKEAVGYCRQGYYWIKDAAKEYMNEE